LKSNEEKSRLYRVCREPRFGEIGNNVQLNMV